MQSIDTPSNQNVILQNSDSPSNQNIAIVNVHSPLNDTGEPDPSIPNRKRKSNGSMHTPGWKEKRTRMRAEIRRLKAKSLNAQKFRDKYFSSSGTFRELHRSYKNKENRIERLKTEVESLKKQLDLDNYLDSKGCFNKFARAMVKLQLHKKKAPFIDVEKTLAKLMFPTQLHVTHVYAKRGSTYLVNQQSVSGFQNIP